MLTLWLVQDKICPVRKYLSRDSGLEWMRIPLRLELVDSSRVFLPSREGGVATGSGSGHVCFAHMAGSKKLFLLVFRSMR